VQIHSRTRRALPILGLETGDRIRRRLLTPEKTAPHPKEGVDVLIGSRPGRSIVTSSNLCFDLRHIQVAVMDAGDRMFRWNSSMISRFILLTASAASDERLTYVLATHPVATHAYGARLLAQETIPN